MTRSLQLSFGAVCIASGILLPILFHAVGFLGPVFLPMHIPVLIAGLFLGWRYGLMTGILAPFLSSLLTGMPPVYPMLPIMTVELAAYGISSGWLYRECRLPLLAALVAAMALGRMAAGSMVFIMALYLKINFSAGAYLLGAIVTGLPGMALQLVLVPFLVRRLAGMKKYTGWSVYSERK